MAPVAPKPPGNLSPKEAREHLRRVLDAAPTQQPARLSANYARNFGDAVEEWLRHDIARSKSV